MSDWNLKLTSAVPTFDWSTITDVVVHLRYTAREGGDLLRDAALKSFESELVGIPLQKSFSALHEFSMEWNAFLRPATVEGEAVLKLDLSEKRFPYFARALEPTISKIELVALVKNRSTGTHINVAVEGGERIEESRWYQRMMYTVGTRVEWSHIAQHVIESLNKAVVPALAGRD